MKKNAKGLALLVSAPLIITTLTACEGSSSAQNTNHKNTSIQQKTAPISHAPKSTINFSVQQTNSSDLTEHPINITSTNGTLKSITVNGPNATHYSIDKKSNSLWSITGLLDPNSKYTISVTSVNSQGDVTKNDKTITTITPGTLTSPTIFPYGNQSVGVGMPITITFKHSVKNRENVEKHLSVNPSKKVEGSWGWTDDKTVVWRPYSFWPSGTTVKYSVNVKGMDLGYGYTGSENYDASFKVGKQLEIDVNNATHNLVVKENGKSIKTMPVSLGRPGKETSSGTNIIYEKVSPVEMKGADYDEMVEYAQRYTSMGEYLHSAPWSVADQGVRNVSHGCVNLSPTNAIWLWKETELGDVVKITGTGKQAQTWDGMGAVWNYSLKDWKNLSALAVKK